MDVTDGKAVDSEDEGAIRVSLGVDTTVDPPVIVLRFGPIEMRMDADTGERFAVDVQQYVYELRNGGRLT
jgi:hypothetical protein